MIGYLEARHERDMSDVLRKCVVRQAKLRARPSLGNVLVWATIIQTILGSSCSSSHINIDSIHQLKCRGIQVTKRRNASTNAGITLTNGRPHSSTHHKTTVYMRDPVEQTISFINEQARRWRCAH
jgi:hypothetical protein